MRNIPTRTTLFDLVLLILIFIGAGFLFPGMIGGITLKITGYANEKDHEEPNQAISRPFLSRTQVNKS